MDEFFADHPSSKAIFYAVQRKAESLGGVSLRVTKSMISFRREYNFAWAWIPGRYLTGRTSPLVLTVSLRWRDGSPRWKEIVEPAPGRFTHHLELNDPAEVDEDVKGWLQDAWELAG